MPSYSTPIAEAVVTLLTGITPNGATVAFRKTDTLLSGDPISMVIVSNERESQTNMGTFGSYDDDDSFGTVFKGYPVQISIYGSNLADLAGDDVNPAFILRAKQLLNKPYLTGVDAVWDSGLLENYEWENVPFSKGVEVSRFGMVFFTYEPRNG